MGGHQVDGRGTGDDGYDEDGYDESQRAEILEATRDGPSDGNLITDLNPDLGGDVEEPDDETDLKMRDGQIGEEGDAEDDGLDEDDQDEDDAQAAFDDDDDDDDDDTLSDSDSVALKP